MVEIIEMNGNIKYLLNGKVHKSNGPAVIRRVGHWGWFLHGKYHRYYGHTFAHGTWMLHGSRIK